jgi:pimeloyl-ACP methyl ester carboxylesterase
MTKRSRWSRALLLFTVLMIVLATEPASSHLRASSLLLRFATPDAPTFVARLGVHVVDESAFVLAAPTGPTRARLYVPRGVPDAPGVVVLHGVHRLGVDEPRLGRFARAIASSGVVVLTPEVKELTEYRIDAASIGTIGAASRHLATMLNRTGVGVLGMSFAGGLTLLAAADPRWESTISFVVAVGAHDDLSRVLRFFAEDKIAYPDGHLLEMKAHDYGMLVLVHSHVEDFFAAEDVEVARDAIRLWLWERPDEARARAHAMSAPGRAKLERFFVKDPALAPELLAVIAKYEGSTLGVSPHLHLGSIHVPVFLLHGAGDSVIPPTETLWLARDVPAPWLRATLVSEAIQHVEIHGEPSVHQRWQLVDFMSQVLDEAEAEPRARPR